MDPKRDDLLENIGLDVLPPGSPQKGAAVPWSNDLATALLQSAGVKGAVLLADTPVPQAPGEASWDWIWSTSAASTARIQMTVFVSSGGPSIARQRLIGLLTGTMHPGVPHVRGPADLGDASAVFAVPPGFAHVAWVFQNVTVSIEQRDDPSADVLAIARAVQATLAKHVIEPIDPALPRVDRIDLSAPDVRVDEPLTIRITMRGADPARRYLVALHDRPDDVRLLDASLTLKVSADSPGLKDLTILVADASTLLTTTAQARMVVKR